MLQRQAVLKVAELLVANNTPGDQLEARSC